MSDIERQIRRETDAVENGRLRRAKNREYRLATDFKPAKDLVSTHRRRRSEDQKLPVSGK